MMPFSSDSEYSNNAPLASYAPPPADPFAPGPAASDVVGAAWRESVPYAALQDAKGIVDLLSAAPGAGADPSFDLKSLIGGTKYEARYLDDFMGVQNETQARALMGRIDQRERDLKTLSDAGWGGTVAQIGLGFIDPTNYIPFIDVMSGAAKSMTIGRIMARSAALGAMQSTAGEAIRQTALPGLTIGDSTENVATATLLSGLLGGALGGLTRGEHASLVDGMDQLRNDVTARLNGEAPASAPMPQAAGAAASDARQLEQKAYLPGPLQKISDMASPMSRIWSSSSTWARRALADLAETPRLFEDNERGLTTTSDGLPPVDRLLKQWTTTRLAGVDDFLNDAYVDYRFGPNRPAMPRMQAQIEALRGTTPDGLMTPKTFNEAVYDALTTGDRSDVPQVQAAAQYLRREVLDPVKGLAQDTIGPDGAPMLSKEAGAPAGDASFAPRQFNKQAIIRQRGQFLDTTTAWLKNEQAKKAAIQGNLSRWNDHLNFLEDQIARKQGAIETRERQVSEAGQKSEELTSLNRFANQRATTLRERADPDANLENARGGSVFETRIRNRGNALQDRLSGKSAELDRLYDELDALTEQRDAARTQIEAELGRWEGKSAAEAKAALKAREKAEAERDAARAAGTYQGKGERLTSADSVVDKTVRRILDSDRSLSDMELRDRANQIADRILSTPDGRLPYDNLSHQPEGWSRDDGLRGSLNDREFAIPTAMIRDFITRDVTEVMHTFMRTVLPDVMLTRRFGDTGMTDTIRKIVEEYAARAEKLTSEKARVKLEKEKQAVLRDLAAIRDRVRGVYGYTSDPGLRKLASVTRAIRSWGQGTDLGSSVPNSLADATGMVFRYGLNGAFRSAWRPFFKAMVADTGFNAVARRNAKAMGIALETHHALAGHQLGDVIDYYKAGSGAEKLAGWAADKSMVANLMAPWTDLQKTMVSSAASDEFLRMCQHVAGGKATKTEIRDLASANISAEKAARIWQQHEASGVEPIDGVMLPDTEKWTDQDARISFEAAIAREADIAVVSPGQEKPLFLSRPIGALLGQFRGFTSAAHERIFVANLQRRDAKTLSGAISTLAAGMMSYKLYSIASGTPVSDRPQDWVKEGINRAGLTGWLSDVNAIQAKFFGGKTDMFRLIGADRPLSRYAQRSAMAEFLGPTWSRMEKLQGPLYDAANGTWTGNDTHALRQWTWLQNHFAIRRLLDKMEGRNVRGD